MKIKLKDQALISYTRSEDAVEALNMTVKNGQARLALQALVDIVNELVEKVDALENSITKSSAPEKVVKQEVKEKKTTDTAEKTVKAKEDEVQQTA